MYDVASKIGPQELISALVGAGGAAMAALAMASRYSGQRSKKSAFPKGFPRDAGANNDNYIRAYYQLVSRTAYTAPTKNKSEAPTALEYALQFFGRSSIVVRRPQQADALEETPS